VSNPSKSVKVPPISIATTIMHCPLLRAFPGILLVGP
jgi:hypothetical protein